MTLEDLIQKLELTPFTTPKDFPAIHPTGGYASDLLSCAMAGAKPGNVWVTLQSHVNIVAVAALTEVCGVIISEGAQPEAAVIEKANGQGVTLLGTKLPTYQVVGKLWELGIH
ncbi:MAG TPA: DRTGG domain-containing protein [Anaerolineales bacterium]|nr:DRTGG domain-containing protein [Anaerolineales bacterium]